jgi:hypothetical protein
MPGGQGADALLLLPRALLLALAAAVRDHRLRLQHLAVLGGEAGDRLLGLPAEVFGVDQQAVSGPALYLEVVRGTVAEPFLLALPSSADHGIELLHT